MKASKKSDQDLSSLRRWANDEQTKKESGQQADQYLLELLSDSIIWAVTRFGNRSKYKEFPKQYCDDYAVFEWASYVYYCIVRWHQDHEIHDNQNSVMSFLVRNFAERFEIETKIRGVLSIIEDRIDLYDRLEKDGESDSVLFLIEQLVMKSTSKQQLEVHVENEPVIIGDFFHSFELKTLLKAQQTSMIPAMIRSVDKFYAMIKEEQI